MENSEADERAIRELVSAWMAATEAGDGEQVLSLIAGDAVFLRAGQPPMRGKSAFAESQAALSQVRIEATAEIQEVRVFGDWAYCWNRLTVIATPRDGGKSVEQSGDTLSILQKRGGRWVLFRDANLLAEVPQ